MHDISVDHGNVASTVPRTIWIYHWLVKTCISQWDDSSLMLACFLSLSCLCASHRCAHYTVPTTVKILSAVLSVWMLALQVVVSVSPPKDSGFWQLSSVWGCADISTAKFGEETSFSVYTVHQAKCKWRWYQFNSLSSSLSHPCSCVKAP